MLNTHYRLCRIFIFFVIMLIFIIVPTFISFADAQMTSSVSITDEAKATTNSAIIEDAQATTGSAVTEDKQTASGTIEVQATSSSAATVEQKTASIQQLQINGTVVNQNGIFIPFGLVDIFAENSIWVKHVYVDENGAFTIDGLASGTYKLRAIPFTCNLYAISNSVFIVIDNNGTCITPVVTIKLCDTQIRGNVYDPRTNSIATGWSGGIEVRTADNVPIRSNNIIGDGSYSIGGLQDGIYKIRANPYDNSLAPSNEITVTIQDGKYNGGNIDFTFNRNQVTGTFHGPNGEVINQNVVLNIYKDESGYPWVEGVSPDINGNFAVNNLQDGSYYLTAIHTQAIGYGNSLWTRITISNGTYNGQPLDIRLLTPQITGTVKDAGGNSPLRWTFHIITYDTNGNIVRYDDVFEGGFHIAGLSDGAYTLQAEPYYGLDTRFSKAITRYKVKIENSVYDGPALDFLVIDKTLPYTPVAYYVDHNNGLDANDGLSEQTPWKTDERAKEQVLMPGDRMMYYIDGSWKEAYPYVPGTVVGPDGETNVGDVGINAVKPDWSFVNGINLDENGMFRFDGLGDGDYLIYALNRQPIGFGDSQAISVKIQNGLYLGQPLYVKFVKTQITGTVMDSSGKVPQEWTFHIETTDDKGKFVHWDNVFGGKFHIGGLPDGTYTLKATANDPSNTNFTSGLTKFTVKIENGEYKGQPLDFKIIDKTQPYTPVTYYVDHNNGLDANDGLTEQTPWKTDKRVDAQLLMPGDRVLFRINGIWQEKARVIGYSVDPYTINDNGFNKTVDEGINRARNDFNFDYTMIEAKTPDDYVTNTQALIDNGIDLVIINSFLASGIGGIVNNNPDKKFAAIDTIVSGSNVESFVFKQNEGSFLLGVMAGKKTKTGKIGFIGGMDIPLIQEFEAGFIAGVKSVNPGAAVNLINQKYIQFTNNFDDQNAGYNCAMTLYNQGCDIIYHAAGRAGLGLFRAAEELKTGGKNVWALGVDVDQAVQNPQYANVILSSMLKKEDNAAYKAVQDFMSGNFAGGTVIALGLKEDGVGIVTPSAGNVSSYIMGLVIKANDMIINGQLSVPDTIAELANFNLPTLEEKTQVVSDAEDAVKVAEEKTSISHDLVNNDNDLNAAKDAVKAAQEATAKLDSDSIYFQEFVNRINAANDIINSAINGIGHIDECFIATAAYGSKFQPAVVLLRHFRDRFLLTNSIGKVFVSFYYRHSPPIARFIAGSPALKFIVRVLLTPIVAVVYLMFHPFFLMLFAVVLGILIFHRVRMKRQLRRIS